MEKTSDSNEKRKLIRPCTAPYINTWLLAGPFETECIVEEYFGNSNPQPAEGDNFNGFAWEYFDDRLFCRNYDDYQDLYGYFKIKKRLDTDYRTAYAHIYIFSPSDRDAEIRIGSNDGFTAWVNGRRVGEKESPSMALRDDVILDIFLKSGWNSLLLRVDNLKFSWGFYARLTGADGNGLIDVVYSVNGGKEPLQISTRGMPFTGNMPVGYRNWPYVWLELVGENPYGNDRQDVQASRFRFQARGGVPPYEWTIGRGALPPGLTLDQASGCIDGKPEALGQFTFTLIVCDSVGDKSEKEFDIEVKERPNQWIEAARLGGLCHGADRIKYVPGLEIEDLVALANRQGYQYICPEANHWVPYFWPAPGTDGLRDYIGEFEKATQKYGMTLGVYFTNFGGWKLENDTWIPPAPLTNDERFMYIEDLITRYDIKLFWFDEFACFNDWKERNFEFDALFSMIKTYSPYTLVINNGWQNTFGRGDIDVIEAECMWGEFYWNEWPKPEVKCTNPKEMPIENWRYPHDSSMYYARVNNEGDRLYWQEWIRVIFSVVGEGHIASIEHTPCASDRASSGEKLMNMRKKIADWMNPGNDISMSEAIVGTRPYALDTTDWGYAVYKRKNLYLYIIRNPRGKTGLLKETFLRLKPVAAFVKKARVMNNGKELKFVQFGDTVEIAAADITEDPVVTVIKIETDRDLSI